jgi:predicted HicB family RNase H-like nuclease
MDETQARPVGRPPIAAVVADLHTRVPAQVYDAIAVEAIRRGIPLAQVVREVLVTHVEDSGYSTTK